MDSLPMIVGLAIIVLIIASWWMVFTKAGKPGWLAIIPIVNTFVLIDIAGKPMWWIILLFIPFVNFVAIILILHGLSENFGQGAGFTIGLLFLSPIFMAILGFGDAQYIGGGKAKAF